MITVLSRHGKNWAFIVTLDSMLSWQGKIYGKQGMMPTLLSMLSWQDRNHDSFAQATYCMLFHSNM